ncbi:fucolectin-5-like [Mya arenaria]|uniref:fucolectin-5-like n=1 Tax=Mya arenaria TaxID=6604 RepID=UPI0022E2BDC0|nr:fucolectin-5-like [Mya arenaria]
MESGSYVAIKYTKGIGNVALGKHAWQSSPYVTELAYPGLAVDGDKTTTLLQDGGNIYFCTHTSTGLTPQWWMVDLERTYQVSIIVVWGRERFGWDSRTKGLAATVGIGVTNMHQCGDQFQGSVSENPFNFTCKSPLVGRFMKIFREDSEPVTLCEVEVYS